MEGRKDIQKDESGRSDSGIRDIESPIHPKRKGKWAEEPPVVSAPSMQCVGLWIDYAVWVVEKHQAEHLYENGFYGKGNLSRSRPQFRPATECTSFFFVFLGGAMGAKGWRGEKLLFYLSVGAVARNSISEENSGDKLDRRTEREMGGVHRLHTSIHRDRQSSNKRKRLEKNKKGKQNRMIELKPNDEFLQSNLQFSSENQTRNEIQSFQHNNTPVIEKEDEYENSNTNENQNQKKKESKNEKGKGKGKGKEKEKEKEKEEEEEEEKEKPKEKETKYMYENDNQKISNRIQSRNWWPPSELCQEINYGTQNSIFSEKNRAIEISNNNDKNNNKDENDIKNNNFISIIEKIPTNEEYLQLGLEEAFYLMDALNCLKVIKVENVNKKIETTLENENRNEITNLNFHIDLKNNTSRKVLSLEECFEEFVNVKPDFLWSYSAYKNFRRNGWVPKSGLKYGTDFVLYRKGPSFYHAEWAVVLQIRDPINETHTTGTRTLSWLMLHNLNRVSEQVAKGLLLCYVEIEGLRPNEKQTVEHIATAKITQLAYKRWIPETTRN